MAGSATDFLEQSIGDHIFRTASYPKPTELYIGLFTTMPDDSGAGYVEVTGFSYARARLDPSDTNWYRSTEGLNRYWNSIPIEFPLQTGLWGTVLGFGLFDQLGRIIVYATLTTPRTIDTSTANPTFPPGYLVIPIS